MYQHPGVKILGQHKGEVWDDEGRRMRRERAEIREMGRRGLGWSGLEDGEGTEAEREVEWVELEA